MFNNGSFHPRGMSPNGFGGTALAAPRQAAALGQPSSVLEVGVRDAAGVPVPGADVVVQFTNTAGGVSFADARTVQTNGQGNAALALPVAPGSLVHVSAGRSGYKPQTIPNQTTQPMQGMARTIFMLKGSDSTVELLVGGGALALLLGAVFWG